MPETRPNRFPDVLLLAAGRGSRLRPLTDSLPKPLVPVAGVPLIERVMANARAEGARHFLANAHYRADQLLAHFAGLVKISREDEVLDTGGGVKKALPLIASDPFFIMNSDAFWPPGADRPLTRMLTRFTDSAPEDGPEDARAFPEKMGTGFPSENAQPIVLLCVQPGRASGFARSHDFCLDPAGRVTRDTGAPVIYGGVALIGRAAFTDMPEGAWSLNRLFEAALARQKLRGVVLDAPWYHVGDLAGLAEAERRLAP